jgi:hypothetical protein
MGEADSAEATLRSFPKTHQSRSEDPESRSASRWPCVSLPRYRCGVDRAEGCAKSQQTWRGCLDELDSSPGIVVSNEGSNGVEIGLNEGRESQSHYFCRTCSVGNGLVLPLEPVENIVGVGARPFVAQRLLPNLAQLDHALLPKAALVCPLAQRIVDNFRFKRTRQWLLRHEQRPPFRTATRC